MCSTFVYLFASDLIHNSANVVFAYAVVRNGDERIFCLFVRLVVVFSFAFAYTVLFTNQFAFISLTHDDGKLCAVKSEKKFDVVLMFVSTHN